MTKDGKVLVKCRYERCTGLSIFKCNNDDNFVYCGDMHHKGLNSYVDWIFFLKNKQHLIEVK